MQRDVWRVISIMNTEVTTIETNETNKNNTLRALYDVICVDDEFALLRRTLELYSEEIAAQTLAERR